MSKRSVAELRAKAAEYRRMAETARVLSTGTLQPKLPSSSLLWRTSASRSSSGAGLLGTSDRYPIERLIMRRMETKLAAEYREKSGSPRSLVFTAVT